MNPIVVAVHRLEHGRGLPLPEIATSLAAGVDLMAAIDETVTIQPGARKLVPTGLAIALPLIGHATWHAYKDLVDPAPC